MPSKEKTELARKYYKYLEKYSKARSPSIKSLLFKKCQEYELKLFGKTIA